LAQSHSRGKNPETTAPVELAKIANNAKLAQDFRFGCDFVRRCAMPTRNVNLTPELDAFLLTRVESGRFENASEVVRAALRTMEREERVFEAKLAALRAAIDEGDASGVAEGDVFAQVRETLHLGAQRS
jgi:antitoxin ParD1/3/4